jgi:hypothetical protein
MGSVPLGAATATWCSLSGTPSRLLDVLEEPAWPRLAVKCAGDLEPLPGPVQPLAGERKAHPRPVRPTVDSHIPSLPAKHRRVRREPPAFRGRLQLFPDELGQAKLPLDDVSLWLATKPGQEHVLAVRLRRRFFDELLRTAVPSSYHDDSGYSRQQWQQAVADSDVRLQWDPDHDPSGRPLDRRAIQLGLRGDALSRYGREALLSIEDITPFVIEQCSNARAPFSQLVTPHESVYAPEQLAGQAVGIDPWDSEASL